MRRAGAAQRARELADLLDNYADCLLQPDLQGRASELHFIALGKLKAIREVIASEEWIERSERNHG